VRHLGPFWGAAELVPNEGIDHRSNRLLDSVAGIDYWLLMSDPAVIGLSTRVQFGATPYMSFTVGNREFERWRSAFESDTRTTAPEFVIQAYVHDGRFLYAGIARAAQLYQFVRDHPEAGYTRRNGTTGTSFRVVGGFEYQEWEPNDLWGAFSGAVGDPPDASPDDPRMIINDVEAFTRQPRACDRCGLWSPELDGEDFGSWACNYLMRRKWVEAGVV
jgi:hypothetical protein